MASRHVLWPVIISLIGVGVCLGEAEVAVLPPGVKAVWDIEKAYKQNTTTRERVSLNGLWQWQPATGTTESVPTEGWGYFKVPGPWPGITDYMQKDCQVVYPHPRWANVRLRDIAAAWYQRTFTIPTEWVDREIVLQAEYVNSLATVFINGQKVDEIVFPGGEVNLTQFCEPGKTYTLSILVEAIPLKGVLMAYTDSNAARQVRGSVARRGLCGDVFLVSRPRGPIIRFARLESSYRHGSVRVVASVQRPNRDQQYRIKVVYRDGGETVHEALSPLFQAAQLDNNLLAFDDMWRPSKVWDIHTPQNQYDVGLSLLDEHNTVLDEWWPMRWGFREFWIDGRDFYLNGTRIFLSAVPLDNAQVGAAWCTYEAACESLRRLKSFGINFVYTHNYDCLPGSHLSFEELLRAADDVGMLVALSQPHFSHYDWQSPDAEKTNGYRQHAEFYTRVAGSHPSVVMYATSHNATGYNEDMNPDLIDGIHDPRDGWSLNNARRALRAEAIIRELDPTRPVYHHSSGNLGTMHTSNFYPNWVPIQELCDWFEHWSTTGVKPFFACEYGAPFTWDWAMYRGWYKGQREFGSAVVPWDFCLAEWNAQFLGDRAYQISEQEKRNLRWEARQFREGRLWHRWDYPHQLGSSDFDERYPILAKYLEDAWRAFRTWEVSAISPWEHHIYWKMRPGLDRNKRTELPTDWENLQRPGYSPDYLEDRYERMDLAYGREDWVPTLAAEAMYRNNMPLLAYIAGPESSVTSRDHVFSPGETLRKQLVIINNCRQKVTCKWRWALSGPQSDGPSNSAVVGSVFHTEQSGEVEIETGRQSRQPVEVSLPPTLPPGPYLLSAEFIFSTGERQTDVFPLEVIPSPEKQTLANEMKAKGAKIGVFDPVGETSELLKRLGIGFQTISADDDPSALDLLIIGKKALTVDGPAPSIQAVRDGLRVLVFEQTGEVMEKRLGFRIAEYGLRQVFPRVPDHPILKGLSEQHLRDWRGSATLLPPRLEYLPSDRYAGAPTVRWCGLEVTRLWRCGNRGNVASVLLEKPQRGDFLSILDGGFALQYTPLVEYREGKGCVLFCQLDVTGRTERDPVAEQIVVNMLRYLTAADFSTPPERRAVYVGDQSGRVYLTQLGVPLAEVPVEKLTSEHVLVVGRGAGKQLLEKRDILASWMGAGGRILLLGMEGDEANSFLPVMVRTESREYINSFFTQPSFSSVFAGIAPADVHNRDPRNIPVLSDGVEKLSDVLGETKQGRIVFCQLLPFDFVKEPDAVPDFRVVTDDHHEGRACAEITMATVPWAQLGQKIASGSVGKTYTFSVWVKPLGKPASVRLEVEQAGPPWTRLARGKDVILPPDQWSEVRLSFTVTNAYPEGWQAYLHVGQPEARLRVDTMRLVEESGDPNSRAGTSKNLFVNGDFEDGTNPWYFNWTTEQQNLRKTFRRTAVMFSRVLANMGLRPTTPLLEWFSQPVQQGNQKSLVKNGNFSEDQDRDKMPDGWTFSCEVPQASCTLEHEEDVPGKTVVCVDVPAGTSDRRTTAMLAQHGVPIQEGQWYRVSFLARAENLSGRQAWIAVQETTKWRALLEYQRFVPGQEWKRYTYLLVGRGTESKNTRLQLWFEGTGKLYLAEVAIVPCDPPTEGRWLHGLYLDRPQEWDDPYRFFRW